MKIIRMQAENLKRLKAVEITPSGSIVEITGRNAQGKTSVLDAIMYTLAGEKWIPVRPIRDGETTARAMLELGDTEVELIATRRFKGDSSTLTLTTPDGLNFPKAQTKLNDLVGALSFDPLAFTRQDAKKQGETLRALAGLDFEAMDAKRKGLYDSRRDYNRDAKALEAQAAGIAAPAGGLPKEPVSVADLAAELDAANRHNAKADEIDRRQSENANQIASLTRDIGQAESQIERLKREVASMTAEHGDRETERATISQEAAAFKPTPTDPIRAKMRDAEATNDAIRQRDRRAEIEKQAGDLYSKSNAATEAMDAIDQKKAKMLANAKLPIDGLGLDDNGVTYQGIPFDQCSAAEQLRVSVAMGLAMNPKLRVMLVRDGSLLDSDSMRLLAEMADANNAQVWVECVAHGDARGIVIEDGEVAVSVAAGVAQPDGLPFDWRSE